MIFFFVLYLHYTLRQYSLKELSLRPGLLDRHFDSTAEENWEVIRLQLQKRFRLLWAPNDVEACNLVKLHGKEIAAVLMDIQLQGSQLDGIKLTQLFRGKLDAATLPPYARDCPLLTVPILFITAYGTRYPERELVAAGANKVLVKPVDFLKVNLAMAEFNLGLTLRTLYDGKLHK